MKTICITFLTCAIIILSLIGISIPNTTTQTEYLRIHIRANSNEQTDQAVKYLIKEELVNYLTPLLTQCETKQDAICCLKRELCNLNEITNSLLKKQGFNYQGNVLLREEMFPTRTYGTLTLDSGYYDALIIELGTAKGDNWWCVVYPPLCFVSTSTEYVYKSKLLEIINDFYNLRRKT